MPFAYLYLYISIYADFASVLKMGEKKTLYP